jgi:hypothetical protein
MLLVATAVVKAPHPCQYVQDSLLEIQAVKNAGTDAGVVSRSLATRFSFFCCSYQCVLGAVLNSSQLLGFFLPSYLALATI